MSLSLYMDENVHGAITTGLHQREVDVLTVQEDNRSGITDPEVDVLLGAVGNITTSNISDSRLEDNYGDRYLDKKCI